MSEKKEKVVWDGVIPNQADKMRQELERCAPQGVAPPPDPRAAAWPWRAQPAAPQEPSSKLLTLLSRAAERGEPEALSLFEASPKVPAHFFQGRNAGWARRLFQKSPPETLAWLMENWCLKKIVLEGGSENAAWLECAADALGRANGNERILKAVESVCEISGESKVHGVSAARSVLEKAILKIAPGDLPRMLRLGERVCVDERATLIFRSSVLGLLMESARQRRGERDQPGLELVAKRAREYLIWVDGREVTLGGGGARGACAELSGLPGIASELLSAARAWGVEGVKSSDKDARWGMPLGMKNEWDPKAAERRMSLVSCALYQDELPGARELLAAGAWWDEAEFFEQRAAFVKGLQTEGGRLRRMEQTKCAQRLAAALRAGEALAMGLAAAPGDRARARPRI